MATDESFVRGVVDRASLGDRFRYRKMFGEYGFYVDDKFVAMACENSFFVKRTRAIEDHGLALPTRPPYPGAKPYAVADGLLDEPEKLARLLVDTAALLPEPKPKKAKKRTGGN